MAELRYTITATVNGAQEIADFKADMASIAENPNVVVDATGITEAAEGLESIAESDAPATLDKVGTSAEGTGGFVGGLNTKLSTLVAAIGLTEIAMRGLDFVVGLFKKNQAEIAAQDAFDAAQVDAYAEALRLAGDEAANLVGILEGDGAVTGSFFGDEIDITEDLAAANITADEFFRTLREDGAEGLNAMIESADEAGASTDALDRILVVGAESLNNLGDAGVTAAASNEVFAESQESANAALQALLNKQDPMRGFTDEWALLMESMADGSIDTTAAAGALNTLADGLNLTTDQVLALAQAELDKTFEEAAAGAEAFADAVGSIDFDAAELTGATTAMAEFTTQMFAAGNEAQTREAAFDALAASAEDVAFTMNMSTDAGRAQQDALEGVARVIDTDLAQAYDAANGSQEAFIAAATQIGDETLVRLQDELNLTDAQVGTLANTLGLTEGDYQARFELAGAEEAQLKLGLLTGAITGLPPSVELTVNTQILAGDYVGALATVQAYYADPANAPTATVEVDANTAPAADDMGAAAAAAPPATIVADADTVTAASDLLDTALEPRTATIVAHAHVAGAEIDLDNLASASRTATIDVDTGSISLPSAGDLAQRIGTIRVPVQAYWNTRIEGNRPGP